MSSAQSQANQRRGLLAKIHVAKTQLRLNEGEWEMIKRSYKVESCADMTIPQLENMVKLLKHYGWKEQIRIRQTTAGTGLNQPPNPEQLTALRTRVQELWGEIAIQSPAPNEKRLAGLVKKICGVDDLTWCRSAAKLERLLAVLGKIVKDGGQT